MTNKNLHLIDKIFDKLWPLNRSITGKDVRKHIKFSQIL